MNEVEQNTDEQMRLMRENIKKNSLPFHTTFETEVGKQVLTLLDAMTKDLSSIAPNEMMDIQSNLTVEQIQLIREGQDQVVRYIKNMVRFYKEN